MNEEDLVAAAEAVGWETVSCAPHGLTILNPKNRDEEWCLADGCLVPTDVFFGLLEATGRTWGVTSYKGHASARPAFYRVSVGQCTEDGESLEVAVVRAILAWKEASS